MTPVRAVLWLFLMPAVIAASLAAVVNFGSLYGFRERQVQTTELISRDITLLAEAVRLSAELADLHERVISGLEGASAGDLKEMAVYRIHSRTVNELALLDGQFEVFAMNIATVDDSLVDAGKLRESFIAYRDFIIMATDIAAVDPRLAANYLTRAQASYFMFASHVGAVAARLADHTEWHSRQALSALDATFLQALVVGLVGLLTMLLLSYYSARRLTGRLATLVAALRRLAKATGDPPPLHEVERLRASDHGELRGMADAVLHFRQTIVLRRQAEARLNRLAYFDELTGLPNRRLLIDQLIQAMKQASADQGLLAVGVIDLDDFKAINEVHGTAAGDDLLVAVAERMSTMLAAEDTLARLSGDEYVILLTNLPDVSRVTQRFSHLLARLNAPMKISGTSLRITASIGIALFPSDEVDAEALIRDADEAMFQAKKEGGNRYKIFDHEVDRKIRAHHEVVSRVTEGIEAGEFLLHYQPKVDMRHGRVIGAEALIRWNHPDEGIIPPPRYMPIVDDSDAVVPVGEWVLEQALQQMSAWASAGLILPVSVNIAASHLQHPEFAARLDDLLRRYPKVQSQWLQLEILESTAMDDIERTSDIIRQCQQLGVHFAIDDFGTGYSSLSYLRRLPADILKIDQSFVRDMLEDPGDLAIVEGIIGLGNAFRRDLIAEGVESIEHGQRLLQLGCFLAQGYGIARPMPAEQIPAWVVAWRPPREWQAQRPASIAAR